VKKRFLPELAAALLLLGIIAVIVLVRGSGCDPEPAPQSCDRPVEIVGGSGSVLWCGRDEEELEGLLERLGMGYCAGTVVSDAREAAAPLFLQLAPNCDITVRRVNYLRGETALALGHPIDVNRASTADLQAIDGLGPALSRRIVESREREGPFCAVEELSRVSGIGSQKVGMLKRYVRADCGY